MKIEDLLRENCNLKSELKALTSAHTSVYEKHSNKKPEEVSHNASFRDLDDPRSTPTLNDQSNEAESKLLPAKQLLEKERKVLLWIFEMYADAHSPKRVIQSDSIMLFSRDFGLSPALIPTADLLNILKSLAPRGDGGKKTLSFPEVNYHL
jgi:hypothetical protein